MLAEEFDRNDEGIADAIAERTRNAAISDALNGIDHRRVLLKPCNKCGKTDDKTQHGYAICENCYDKIHGVDGSKA